MSNTLDNATPPTNDPITSGHRLATVGELGSQWETRCHELLVETQRLRDQLLAVQAERDQFKKTIYHFLRKEAPIPTFAEDDVFAVARTEPTFGELITELEMEFGKDN